MSTKIECRRLWKIYGPGAERLMARSSSEGPSREQISAAKCIGAVCDVTFDVKAGEILVIMGLSGSGKSTLLRCLCRLIEVTAGEIRYEGLDLLKVSESQLIELRRHKIGMVFQHFGLLPHRTVIENVAFPLELQGIERSKRLDRAEEMLRLVGLQGREGYFPTELSGGQQQRVGLARSLAADPDLWLLDEPFSALDPLIRREMQQEFIRIQRLLHKTIVFVTHDFDEAIRLADRIAIMKDGRIVQVADCETLVMNPVDEYVAQFTREAPRQKLLSARAVMSQFPGAVSYEHSVPATAKLQDIAQEVLGNDKLYAVLNDGGVPIGVIDRGRLVEAVFGTPAGAK
jgi:glycine betaine/proline transport system ATP-binding protein